MSDLWPISFWNQNGFLDRTKARQGVIRLIDEQNQRNEFSFDCLTKNGKHLIFYRFQSESHRDSYNKLKNSSQLKLILDINDYCFNVFECDLLK